MSSPCLRRRSLTSVSTRGYQLKAHIVRRIGAPFPLATTLIDELIMTQKGLSKNIPRKSH
ncbi:hypothetical protein PMG11_04660 [Penicillium brasilianum]|uniref:Uncharacterized protein n=1 Tax=Penicillium brasilianum TaxID=104259 RepID=A0A0F7VGK2_PENBI|nr:hypothetical protein PMG11_04660 [Penicillium brasilianum]